MSAIVIDKNVPIPGGRGGPRGEYSIALHSMAIGESFAVEASAAPNARGALHFIQGKTKKRFVTRKIGDQVRIWRIEDAA